MRKPLRGTRGAPLAPQGGTAMGRDAPSQRGLNPLRCYPIGYFVSALSQALTPGDLSKLKACFGTFAVKRSRAA